MEEEELDVVELDDEPAAAPEPPAAATPAPPAVPASTGGAAFLRAVPPVPSTAPPPSVPPAAPRVAAPPATAPAAPATAAVTASPAPPVAPPAGQPTPRMILQPVILTTPLATGGSQVIFFRSEPIKTRGPIVRPERVIQSTAAERVIRRN